MFQFVMERISLYLKQTDKQNKMFYFNCFGEGRIPSHLASSWSSLFASFCTHRTPIITGKKALSIQTARRVHLLAYTVCEK